MKEFRNFDLFVGRKIIGACLIISWFFELNFDVLLEVRLFEPVLKLISFEIRLLIGISESTYIRKRRRIWVLFFRLVWVSLIRRIYWWRFVVSIVCGAGGEGVTSCYKWTVLNCSWVFILRRLTIAREVFILTLILITIRVTLFIS